MTYCLVCHNEIPLPLSWQTVLGLAKQPQICEQCQEKLALLQGACCERCNRPSNKDVICYDCLRWEQSVNWNNVLEKNRSCYQYNPFLKEIIGRFKYRGDAALAQVFAKELQRIYNKNFSNFLLVPIPLSKKRQYARGFNQAELLAQLIGEPLLALTRTNDETKQSKKSRRERVNLHQPFQIELALKDKVQAADILLVDDIYTTGTTVRLAAKVLRQHGAKVVSSLTVAR